MKRYYIDTQGKDKIAYMNALKFACDLGKEVNIKNIILLEYSKKTADWLFEIFNGIKRNELFKGFQINNCNPKIIVKTIKTLNKVSSSNIIIAFGFSSDQLFKIDSYLGYHAIITLPYLKNDTKDWLKLWGPLEIQKKTNHQTFNLPQKIIQIAFKELTNTTYMSSAPPHPDEEEKSKTYIKVLHKNFNIDSSEILFYLVRKLGWEIGYALRIKNLFDTLSEGKYFHGGSLKNKKELINRWKSIGL